MYLFFLRSPPPCTRKKLQPRQWQNKSFDFNLFSGFLIFCWSSLVHSFRTWKIIYDKISWNDAVVQIFRTYISDLYKYLVKFTRSWAFPFSSYIKWSFWPFYKDLVKFWNILICRKSYHASGLFLQSFLQQMISDVFMEYTKGPVAQSRLICLLQKLII